jgi:hypothetical protein
VALGQHHEDGLVVAFAAAIKTNPDPPVRVQLVLDTIVAPTTPQTQTSSEWWTWHLHSRRRPLVNRCPLLSMRWHRRWGRQPMTHR